MFMDWTWKIRKVQAIDIEIFTANETVKSVKKVQVSSRVVMKCLFEFRLIEKS